jgi:hypothetical protein
MVSTRRDDWHKQPGPVTGDTAPGFTTIGWQRLDGQGVTGGS